MKKGRTGRKKAKYVHTGIHLIVSPEASTVSTTVTTPPVSMATSSTPTPDTSPPSTTTTNAPTTTSAGTGAPTVQTTEHPPESGGLGTLIALVVTG